jgi:hypothetical protein
VGIVLAIAKQVPPVVLVEGEVKINNERKKRKKIEKIIAESQKPLDLSSTNVRPLFSIYPYRQNKYTVTDVQYTPMYMSENIKDLKNYKGTINEVMIDNLRSKIEDKIIYYYGGFKTHFKYDNYYTSVKVKRSSESADRYPTIIKNNNVITCVTGKIQGIYTLEDYIKNEIINR